MMADELKPCPFCGGEAALIGIRDGQQVSCKGKPRVPCFAKGPAVFHGPKGWAACEAEAIAAWNTRPAPKADSALVGEFESAMKVVADEIGALRGNRKTDNDERRARRLRRFERAFSVGERVFAALSDRDVVLEEALRALLDDMRLTSPDDDYQLGWTGAIDAVLSQIPAIRALKGGVDE
ncbi:MAG: hypothetical protein GOVbin7759_17 [Prokaryotic dsDNA virus sp.]|jgi:hypothetical protein|nr:MAG: hypothetical protein GOVbin7759_17 [Prokaryotic dsDNA virus sp.]